MNPLRGKKNINSYSTIINALRAIKTLNFLVKGSVLHIYQSIINPRISRINLNY